MKFGDIFQLGMGLASAKQQYDAGKDAEKNAKRNAEFIRRETAEQSRRLKSQQRRQQSTLRARMAASGVKMDGSSKTFLEEYVQEDERQLQWLEESGESRANLTRQAGKDEESAYRSRALSSFFSSVNDFGSKSGWWT